LGANDVVELQIEEENGQLEIVSFLTSYVRGILISNHFLTVVIRCEYFNHERFHAESNGYASKRKAPFLSSEKEYSEDE
jgi:hypothetical protein